MKNKGFTLIELLVVVAIIGILAAVGVVAYSGYTKGAKINAAKENHKTVVNFIMANFAKCEIGEELILKQNPTTNTSDLCPYVLAGNANKMATQLSYHFNSLKWCNPIGWKHNSGTCIEAVETGTTTKHIKEAKLIPILTKALQEAMTRIETLEAKVKALEEA